MNHPGIRRVGPVEAPKATKSELHRRIDALAHRIEYRRMVDFEDREAIYHLRRNAYSRHKGDSDAWGAAAIDRYDEENAQTIGLFIDGELVGSFKIMVVDQDYRDCQSRSFFPDEVDKLLDDGMVLIDPVRFVADTRATARYPELPYLLIRIPILACQYFEADACLSLIRKEHRSFYKRIFRSEIIAGPKWYEPLQIDALLMCGSVDAVRNEVLERFPFWRAEYFEMRQLFGSIEDWPAAKRKGKQAA